MRISDWSSDVCSSDLGRVYAALAPYVCAAPADAQFNLNSAPPVLWLALADGINLGQAHRLAREPGTAYRSIEAVAEALRREGINNADLGAFSLGSNAYQVQAQIDADGLVFRSEEHTSELQSLMRISYAVFCLKKKNTK